MCIKADAQKMVPKRGCSKYRAKKDGVQNMELKKEVFKIQSLKGGVQNKEPKVGCSKYRA